MPLGSGRKSSSLWTEVMKIEGESKCKCKHCENIISCKIERIRTHLNKCCARKNKPKIGVLQNKGSNNYETPSSSCSQSEVSKLNVHDELASSSSTSNDAPKEKVQKFMNQFCLKTTDKEKAVLDKHVANFFYAANISFNAANLNQYKVMFEALRPGYNPPSDKDLGNKLLDNAAEEVDQDLSNKAKTSSLTLTLDGWSNVKNDPIQSVTIHTGVESFLLTALDSGSTKKTAENCAGIVEAAIEDCRVKFNKEIFAVVTDNENKMTKMWEILNGKFPNLITYGCSAHLLNLVEKDVSPRSVLKHIVQVQKYFRNVHIAHGWLKEKKGVMPQIPNETRWNSHPDCIKTFVCNYHKYREIAMENPENFEKSISKILENTAIYHEALHLEKQLKIVAKALDNLQKDSTSISEAVEIWIDLLSEEILQPYLEHFKKRFDQAIQPPHLLANLMDPKFRGKRLSSLQENIAETWLAKLHHSYLPGVMAFKIKDTEYYPTSVMAENIVQQFSSAKWWQIVGTKAEKGSKLPPEFCEFFYSLHSCPASSASIERYFSSFSLVWNKLRNRLGIEKATKLVKVYKSLRNEQ